MLNCGGGGLNGKQLAMEPLNFREGRAEVEEWGWGKSNSGCLSSIVQLTKGKRRDGRRVPVRQGDTSSQAEQEKAIWPGQGHSFVTVQGTPGKTVKSIENNQLTSCCGFRKAIIDILV